MAAIEGEWAKVLQDEFKKPYYKELYEFVKNEYKHKTVYPKSEDLFTALELTTLPKTKVVILGQDPYHEPGQAHGLAFSVKQGVKLPPSLQNIYKELNTDLGLSFTNNGDLSSWAKQGVLLLNTCLTVRAHEANSHKDKGWEQFTDRIILEVDKLDSPVVFMLWGSNARAKKKILNNKNHLILESVHPSPLSVYRGFFGCKHFSKANEYLVNNGLDPIDWGSVAI